MMNISVHIIESLGQRANGSYDKEAKGGGCSSGATQRHVGTWME
jgi:hypothetical protein